MNYWDTSCLLKLYTSELDSEAYEALFAGESAPWLTSEITTVEFNYALLRKEAMKELKRGACPKIFDRFQEDAKQGRVVLIPFDEQMAVTATRIARDCYGHRPAVHLRALDGIHLAAALSAKATGLVTTDQRMQAAAQVLKIPLVEPQADQA